VSSVIVLTREQVTEIAVTAARAARELENPYYTQDCSPLGKARHVELLRAGVIKGWKRGRTWFARREDVHAWIEQEESEAEVFNLDVMEQRLKRAGVR